MCDPIRHAGSGQLVGVLLAQTAILLCLYIYLYNLVWPGVVMVRVAVSTPGQFASLLKLFA